MSKTRFDNQSKSSKYYWRNVERKRKIATDSYRRQRDRVIQEYGSRCACCGETTKEFLALDHINGDGREHRKAVIGSGRGSSGFYSWVIRHKFPPDLQLLCHNCNSSLGYYGYCPHRPDYKRPRKTNPQKYELPTYGQSEFGFD